MAAQDGQEHRGREGLLFLPDVLDLALSRSGAEFRSKLARKVRLWTIWLVIIVAFCIVWRVAGIDQAIEDVPALIPPPPAGGCACQLLSTACAA